MEMQKAYDLEVLGQQLKEQGVDFGKETLEEGAKIALKTLFPWLTKSAEISENKVDDMLAPLYPIAQKHAMDLAEDINKADNE